MAVLLWWLLYAGLLGLCVCTALSRWNEVRSRKKGLAPGTMGWLFFGETAMFVKEGPEFMKKQRARYGDLFKTHILGYPTIICMDPDVNRFLLLNEGKGLVPRYPESMVEILGESNISAANGPLHKNVRGALLSLVGFVNIKAQLLPKLDESARLHLSGWEGKIIDIQERTKELTLRSSMKQMVSLETGPFSDELRTEFYKLAVGTISLPINFPGTNFRRGLQARKKVLTMLRQVLAERRASANTEDDMLGTLLRVEESSRAKLNDEQIMDLMITILYSGYETVSTTCMMTVKYLHDHPTALQQLRDEHLAIRKGKKPAEAINWEDYKSMNFTRAVIYETMRLATIVNGVFRKNNEDIQLKGYTIPKGWKFYVYTREANYDPFLYPEPFTFNPWRWLSKSFESSPHYLMFGAGTRFCPGKEWGLVEVAIFLHYFVTKYSWEEVGKNEIIKFPRVKAPDGLRIRVSKYGK